MSTIAAGGHEDPGEFAVRVDGDKMEDFLCDGWIAVCKFVTPDEMLTMRQGTIVYVPGPDGRGELCRYHRDDRTRLVTLTKDAVKGPFETMAFSRWMSIAGVGRVIERRERLD